MPLKNISIIKARQQNKKGQCRQDEQNEQQGGGGGTRSWSRESKLELWVNALAHLHTEPLTEFMAATGYAGYG